MIRENGMNPGDRLLSEKKLGESFNVNHVTVRAALSDLEKSGVVERRPGSGTFVTHSLQGSDRTVNVAGKLAVIAMWEEEHFHSKLRNAIAHELEKNGYMCLSSNLSDSIPILIEQLKVFQERGVSCLIIDQTQMTSKEMIDFLYSPECRYEKIVRILGNGFCKLDLPGVQVTGDYKAAYSKAIEVFKDLGHRRIAYFCGSTDPSYDSYIVNKQYINLYTSTMIEYGLAEYIMVRTGTGVEDFDKAVEELLTCPNRPTAIFADIDYRGIRLIERARELGIEVPGDLSIIGFNDTPWSEHFNLSTFHFRIEELGQAVAEVLENNHGDSEKILIPIDYIEKKTVSHPKK